MSHNIEYPNYSPMLATLTRDHFSDPKWIYEPKLDGIRCLAFRKGSNLNLYSRNRLSLNDTFSEIIGPLLMQKPKRFVVDGEAVALQGEVSRFAKLQQRAQKSVQIFYYIFDILHLDGVDLRNRPLIERKEILK